MMEDQKTLLAKQMENLSKAVAHTGELSDDALEGVSGGAVAGRGAVSKHMARATCPACGFRSDYFNPDDIQDLKVIIFDHVTFKGCQNSDFNYEFFD